MSEAQKPVVTVVMPLYNKEAEVGRAVRSTLLQTVSDIELIVVNDGSTDNGPEIVHGIDDPRVRIIDQKNAGVSAARNRGIHEAKSDLIAFLDADDEWKPSFLEMIFHLKEKFPTCKVFATNYICREVNGADRFPIIKGLPSHPWEGILEDYFEVASKSDPPLCASAVAVTKEAVKTAGLFPVGVTAGEDLLTWARLALKYKIAYTTKTCSIFYEPGNVFERPGRFADTTDVVGKELTGLLRKVAPSEKKSLKNYIALWHKNRTVSFLELGNQREALQELYLMSDLSIKTIKWYLYALIAILPKRTAQWMIKGIKTAKALRPNVKNVRLLF